MMSFAGALLRGAAAGAAGTTALNAVTYLDMAVRGRPSSSTPEKTVETVADAVGVSIPGSDDTRRNRIQGLGPLLGLATGVGIGALAGVLVRARPLPVPLLALLVGGGAMAGSNLPMSGLGVTDPRTWSAGSWISDAVPHAAYGAVTAALLRALVRP
jgi:hypothetical protein